jgi:hypothetical protein
MVSFAASIYYIFLNQIKGALTTSFQFVVVERKHPGMHCHPIGSATTTVLSGSAVTKMLITVLEIPDNTNMEECFSLAQLIKENWPPGTTEEEYVFGKLLNIINKIIY